MRVSTRALGSFSAMQCAWMRYSRSHVPNHVHHGARGLRGEAAPPVRGRELVPQVRHGRVRLLAPQPHVADELTRTGKGDGQLRADARLLALPQDERVDERLCLALRDLVAVVVAQVPRVLLVRVRGGPVFGGELAENEARGAEDHGGLAEGVQKRTRER